MSEIREIVMEGDPLLRQQSQEVRRFGSALHRLLDDMKATMYHANGCGLAAPQVGVSKRLIVVDDFDELGFMELVNPVIVQAEGRNEAVEHCLSVADRGGLVIRAEKIRATYQNRDGEARELSAEGQMARILQHEIDHLDGKLFVDVMVEEVPD